MFMSNSEVVCVCINSFVLLASFIKVSKSSTKLANLMSVQAVNTQLELIHF